MSSYGGGMLEGDCVRLRIDCGVRAGLYLSTQALSKVYKCPNGQAARQQIAGDIAEGGFVVTLPDPVVPYAGSRFSQHQEWALAEGAILILADGHTAGRLQGGERFVYSAYESELHAEVQGRKILFDRYESVPEKGSKSILRP